MVSHFLVGNVLLVAASGYAMYDLTPKVPYAFGACAIACFHGLLSMLNCCAMKRVEFCFRLKEVSTSFVQIIPLSLIVMQMYKYSNNFRNYAFYHIIFIIPLAFDLISKFKSVEESSVAYTMKNVMILANILSLLFLSYSDDNLYYTLMATAAFCSRFVSRIVEDRFPCFEDGYEITSLLFDTLMFIILSQVFEK